MNIMQSPFVQKIIQKHYHHFDEDEKRNVSVFLILDLMMVFVMGTWARGVCVFGKVGGRHEPKIGKHFSRTQILKIISR